MAEPRLGVSKSFLKSELFRGVAEGSDMLCKAVHQSFAAQLWCALRFNGGRGLDVLVSLFLLQQLGSGKSADS